MIHAGLQAALTESGLPYVLSDTLTIGGTGIFAYLSDTQAKQKIPVVWSTTEEQLPEEKLVDFIYQLFRNMVESLSSMVRYQKTGSIL